MGALFLLGYVVSIGVATYLMKVSLRSITAYQINVFMGLAMLAVSVPAALIADGTLGLRAQRLGLVIGVSVLMAIGSIFYALALGRLPAGPAAAMATSYVVVVVVLSAIFLRERIDLVTGLGVTLTVAGVAVLSFRT